MTDPPSQSMVARLPNERARAKELTALVADLLPMSVEARSDHGAWPLIGAGLLSRATTTLRHTFDLSYDGQALDAATLGRSLYEHVVHFAWLAADPSAARLEEWRKDDLKNRLKADSDCRSLGIELFDDATRASSDFSAILVGRAPPHGGSLGELRFRSPAQCS
jgi:hypothetical protein